VNFGRLLEDKGIFGLFCRETNAEPWKKLIRDGTQCVFFAPGTASDLPFPLPSTFFLSLFLSKMPRSKKGRLTGAARKEINERRAADAVSGRADGVIFARVHKLTGSGHVRVLINCKHGSKEIPARIPNIFGRRGATPITSKDIVGIYVGPDFDADAADAAAGHFDITAILTHRQAYKLSQAGEIPSWMLADIGGDDDKAKAVAGAAEGGFEFDYGERAEESDSETDSEKEGTAGFTRKGHLLAVAEEVDVDAI
jgi:hypothetical protein